MPFWSRFSGGFGVVVVADLHIRQWNHHAEEMGAPRGEGAPNFLNLDLAGCQSTSSGTDPRLSQGEARLQVLVQAINRRGRPVHLQTAPTHYSPARRAGHPPADEVRRQVHRCPVGGRDENRGRPADRGFPQPVTARPGADTARAAGGSPVAGFEEGWQQNRPGRSPGRWTGSAPVCELSISRRCLLLHRSVRHHSGSNSASRLLRTTPASSRAGPVRAERPQPVRAESHPVRPCPTASSRSATGRAHRGRGDARSRGRREGAGTALAGARRRCTTGWSGVHALNELAGARARTETAAAHRLTGAAGSRAGGTTGGEASALSRHANWRASAYRRRHRHDFNNLLHDPGKRRAGRTRLVRLPAIETLGRSSAHRPPTHPPALAHSGRSLRAAHLDLPGDARDGDASAPHLQASHARVGARPGHQPSTPTRPDPQIVMNLITTPRHLVSQERRPSDRYGPRRGSRGEFVYLEIATAAWHGLGQLQRTRPILPPSSRRGHSRASTEAHRDLIRIRTAPGGTTFGWFPPTSWPTGRPDTKLPDEWRGNGRSDRGRRGGSAPSPNG
jgi:hypothetical protein